MSDSEPNLIKEFRGLYDYVRLMGEHVNQIYSRLEAIEKNINEISSSHRRYVMENKAEITNIRENMVNKSEFSTFIEGLRSSMGETLPPLPTLVKEPTATAKISQEANER